MCIEQPLQRCNYVKTHANGTQVYLNSFVSLACVMSTCTEIHWLKVSTFLTRAVFSTDAIDQKWLINLSSVVTQARNILNIGLGMKEITFPNFNELYILTYETFLYFPFRNWINSESFRRQRNKIDLLLALLLTIGEVIRLTKYVVRVVVMS